MKPTHSVLESKTKKYCTEKRQIVHDSYHFGICECIWPGAAPSIRFTEQVHKLIVNTKWWRKKVFSRQIEWKCKRNVFD